MENYDVAESGYPEEQEGGAAPDDAPGTAPQESSSAPNDSASRAPDQDEGQTATGNPQTEHDEGV